MTSPPILTYPVFTLPFIVHTDASERAIGGVLSQVQEGEERVIVYWSLNKVERNYSTVEREALAVVAAVKEFYPYLYGFHFTLVTDHNPLTSLKGLKDVHGRLTRWITTFLQQFDFQFKYRPGGHHGNADVFSRRPPEKPEVLATILEMVSMGLEDVGVAQAQDEALGPIMIALQRGEKMPAGLPKGSAEVLPTRPSLVP